jgi:alanyl aminopeptidase
MRNAPAIAALLGLLVVSCSGEAPAPSKMPPTLVSAAATIAESPNVAANPPALRLARTVVPTRASVTLTLVATEENTHGIIDFDVTVTESTRIIWLNAREIAVDEATVRQGGETIKVEVIRGNDEFLGLRLEKDIRPGVGVVHIAYRGKIDGLSDRGIFRQREGDDAYLFTQFEAIDARRAFPCFDEPSFKIPWDVTLRVKPNDKAFSNAPMASEKIDGELKVVRFATTKPLPSYLVAFAVGPFDIVDVGKGGRNATPIRIIVPKGQGAETAYAADITPKSLKQLEDYFDLPYPYEKLDIVSVPRLRSFGAMENAGLITIRSSLALMPAGTETAAFQRNYTSIMTHEIAHQWFGDLVTLAWWEDVWLNEAFATWMATKITARLRPDLGIEVGTVNRNHSVMIEDSLRSSRKIRQEIQTKNDIQNAFDGITYVKGAAVIGMFEQSTGAEPFRKGIQHYLSKRAMGNATSTEFLADVSEGSGKDLRAAFGTFLDRPGVPIVRASLSCTKEDGRASISIAQQQYESLGSQGQSAASLWQFPVCVRHGDGKTADQTCGVLNEKSGTISLPGTKCPEWFALKENGVGYYRATYTLAELTRLLDKKRTPLGTVERLGISFDMQALVQAGKLSIADAFELVPLLAKDDEVAIVRSGLSLVSLVKDELLSDALRPKFTKFVRDAFGAQAKAVGLRAKPKETLEQRMFRSEIVPFVAIRGEDKPLIDEAKKLAFKWLDDPKSLAKDEVNGVLRIAVWFGDRALLQRMRSELKKTTDKTRIGSLVEGLGAFHDPALVREALSIVLTDEILVLDAMGLFSQEGRNHAAIVDFLKSNIDAVLAKLPTEFKRATVDSVRGICDEKRRLDVETLFKDRVGSIVGGPRKFAQALEGASLCIAQENAVIPSLVSFLEKWK